MLLYFGSHHSLTCLLRFQIRKNLFPNQLILSSFIFLSELKKRQLVIGAFPFDQKGRFPMVWNLKVTILTTKSYHVIYSKRWINFNDLSSSRGHIPRMQKVSGLNLSCINTFFHPCLEYNFWGLKMTLNVNLFKLNIGSDLWVYRHESPQWVSHVCRL